jgi:hypothetical protein
MMNNFNAVGIAEGFIECEDEDTLIKAWQHLIDTGLAWTLQGWFGRRANDLIEAGICKARKV